MSRPLAFALGFLAAVVLDCTLGAWLLGRHLRDGV